ncbi:MAG: hypothetical protein DWQ01_13100 [Planctomycetota bacterium]|nr:MAG: hypothetical protein DWQ01_13100 [Planctomycetota bacterium]
MQKLAPSLAWFRTAALLGGALLASCQAETRVAIADLAAIHNDSDWSPRSPAQMAFPPGFYGVNGESVAGFLAGEPQEYEIQDHRALELAILNRLRGVNPGLLEDSLEATAWLIIELLHDDHRDARVMAAVILSEYAAFWVDKTDVRLHPDDYLTGNLAEAVQEFRDASQAIEAPDYVDRVHQSLQKVDRAPIPDPLLGARLVAAMARQYAAAPIQVTGGKIMQRTALRSILAALEKGTDSEDPEVASTCRERYRLVLEYAQR